VDNILRYLRSVRVNNVIQYSTKEELVKELGSVLGKGNCVKELIIYGHSNQGQFATGKGQMPYLRTSTFIAVGYPPFERDWKNAFVPLKQMFCKDSRLRLMGCNVGGGIYGARLVYELAKYLNVEVVAPVNFVPSTKDYSGPWQKADPSMSAPPSPIQPSDSQFVPRGTPRTIRPPRR
jgi:hypothetical protein